MAENNLGDILSQITNQQGQVDYTKLTSNSYSATVAILAEVKKISQALAADQRASGRSNTPFKDRADQKQQDPFQSLFGKGKSKGKSDSIIDSFEQVILDEFLGKDFKRNLGQAAVDFTKQFGLDLTNIRGSIGKRLGESALSIFKSSELGKQVFGYTDQLKQQFSDWASKSENFKSFANIFNKSPNGTNPAGSTPNAPNEGNGFNLSNIGDVFKGGQSSDLLNSLLGGEGIPGLSSISNMLPEISNVLPEFTSALPEIGAVLPELGPAVASASAALPPLGVAVAAAAAAMVAIELVTDKLMKTFAWAGEATQNLVNTAQKAMDRYESSRRANIKDAQTRLASDVKSLIEEPFNILKDAAEEVYKVWDAQLRKITATQGYDKAGMQELMSEYAQRLKDEGLTRVINPATITENLAKVIDAGLSGPIAEEFAYLATKLEAAVPTQDFFGLAAEYSSIAANAIRAGRSQEWAISSANRQLEQFTADVLQASRQLAGGFSTGLKDAGQLFKDAVKIAQAAKTDEIEISKISGVLTAVAANVGAIAPDLATELVDAVVKAATGGNASELVALRSLAGINASNTEFLNRLATDPKAVFTAIFRNLGSMQNLAPGANLEVAEGISKVFGLSMDSFARVDFNYLADSIQQMKMNDSALAENIELLKSGETTLTAEQLRNQQITNYMIDEGLAYVLDNAVSRSIQEHMWQEQIAQENREATYGVELQGAALDFLAAISQTVQNIINLLNPFSWLGGLADLAGTVAETAALEVDLRRVIESGKVGTGRFIDAYNLSRRGVDLNLAQSYLYQTTGLPSAYEVAKGFNDIRQAMFNPLVTLSELRGSARSGIIAEVGRLGSAVINTGSDLIGQLLGKSTGYKWSTTKATKSLRDAFNNIKYPQGPNLSGAANVINASINDIQAGRVKEMLGEDYMKEYTSYEKWLASGKELGIQDVSAALKAAGYDEANVRKFFEQQQVIKAAEENRDRVKNEDAFWEQGKKFWETQVEKDTTIIDILTGIQTSWITWNEDWTKFHTGWQNYFRDWTRYFIEHTYYSEASGIDIKAIQAEEKKQEGQAIYALADALSGNIEGLKDPTVQTNALLAKILLVVTSILNQGGSAGNYDLMGSLMGLAMGGTPSQINSNLTI